MLSVEYGYWCGSLCRENVELSHDEEVKSVESYCYIVVKSEKQFKYSMKTTVKFYNRKKYH